MLFKLRVWATNRMVGALIKDNIRKTGYPSGEWSLNPEDWDEVAYVMLYGLLGLEPKP